MKVKIWGARGSIPAPIRPEAIREKIVSALLGIGKLEGNLRDNLISAILNAPPANLSATDETGHIQQKQRRQIVDNYLERLSLLSTTTAGGNTPCIEISSGNEIFIIDAGSGIRDLGQKLMQGPCGRGEGIVHIFFSHPHWDHIQGFPFFRPAFIPGNKLFLYGVHDMEAALHRQQEFISFPISLDYMQAAKTFTQIKPNEVLNFGELRIRNICNHHPGDAYGYRFEKGNKSFVYASDASYPEGMDLRPYLNFFTEADLLIFDAQFTQRESDEKEDWGHSSSFVGVEMAQQAKVKNLLLFHYDPTYSDQDLEKILDDTLKFQQNQYPAAPPVNVMIAREGLEFDLTTPPSTQVQQVPGSKAAILKPGGIFDEQVAAKMRENLSKMVTDNWPSQLIIDMTKVEMLQVAGLRGLVKLRKEHQGRPMALAGPSINVQQLIELAGYLDFFAIYPSVHTALNALKARETLSLPGQVLKERYQIDSKIGEGRLGTVFKATDTLQDSAVAIKILSPSFSETALEQFLGQARQIVNLNHANIVNVYDCDEDRGISFMAEELLGNKTLQKVIDEYQGKPISEKVALSVAQGIIRALEYAHNYGVIHGDLKPKNVLMAADTVKVSDFGLGRLEGGKVLINFDVPLALVSARYLAPEQVMGQEIDTRTDLYAFGVILYELFTGALIFTGSDQEIIEFHRSQSPTPPRELNPQISRPLEHLILRLLDKDPAKRYSTARQVRQTLNSMTVTVSRDNLPPSYATERTPALTGRSEAMQQLTELWAKTKNGQGQIVFISGQAGVGKTRLLQELAGRLDQATILMGDCQRAEGDRPYQPFTSALETYLQNTPEKTASKNVGQVYREISNMIPEISQALSTPAATVTGTAAPAQRSVLQSIGQVTAEFPWLLILDDLHFLGSNSVKLLDYLARHAGQMSLMIVGAFDQTVVSQNTAFEKLAERVSQQANCTTITLKPLAEEGTQQLLESIWSQSVPEDLVKAICNRTQGNPFFIETIANGLIDESVINWRDEKWHFGPVMDVGLPKNIDNAILRRINHLSRETQSLLNQAAILGPIFSFDDLNELSDLSEWDALESINIALERQLLKNAPGEQVLRFSHPLVQKVLYNNLSSLKQRLLHREAGEALERRYAAEAGKIAEQLARHFFKAGEMEKGMRYSIRAGKQARKLYANQNALYWFTLALDMADLVDPNTVTRDHRFDLLLSLENLHHIQGNREEQNAILNNLQNLAQILNDPVKQAQVHNRRAIYEYAMSNPTEATTEAQTGLIAARQATAPVLESESLIQLATVALYRGQFDTAREHLYAAKNNLAETEQPKIEARRLNGLGALYQFLNDYTESEQYYRQAVEMSHRAGDRNGEAVYLSNLGEILLKKGDFSDALLHQQQALTIARMTGNTHNKAHSLNRLAATFNKLGSFDIARTFAEESKLLHYKIGDEQGMAMDLRILGALSLANKDYVTARDYIGQALEIFQYKKHKSRQGKTWLDLAMALEGLGHLPKATHAFQQVHGVAAELGNQTGVLDAKTGLARCLLAENKLDEANDKIAGCLKELSAGNVIWQVIYPANFYLTLNQVLQAAGQAPEAESILSQGLALIQDRAHRITDPHLRSAFLENVPANKSLLNQQQEKTE